MNLKTSLSKGPVSRALLKANLRTHWVWPVAVSILLSFNVFVVRDMHAGRVYEVTLDRFIYNFSFAYFVSILYSILTATKLFMYLDKPNSVSFMHGNPLSRLKLYVTTLCSGGILTVIPPLAAMLLMLVLQLSRQATGFTLYRCFAFFAVYMIYGLIAFAVAAFSMTFCGNVIVSVLLTCGIIVLPAAVIGFVIYILVNTLYGYTVNDAVLHFLEKLYILPEYILSWDCLIYLAGTVVFLTAGYFIYKMRPLENCGEVVAFRKLRVLFTVVVGIVMGMISYMFFSSFFSTVSLLWMLPLGLVGVIGANMIARKTVGLRGSGIHVFSYVALTLLLTLALSGDWFGYERRVPQLSDVKTVLLTGSDIGGTAELTSPEDINAVLTLHDAYVSQRNDKSTFEAARLGDYNKLDETEYYRYDLSLTYTMKNGTHLRRSYDYISEENYQKYLLPLYDTEAVKKALYPILREDVTTVNATIYDDRITTPAVTFTGKDLELLLNAIERDMEEHTARELRATSDGALRLNFEYYIHEKKKLSSREEENAVITDITPDGRSIFTKRVRLNEAYTNTLAALEELGYDIHNTGVMEKADKATLRLYSYWESDGSWQDYSQGSWEDKEIPTTQQSTDKYPDDGGWLMATVKNPEHIRLLYDRCGFGWSNNEYRHQSYPAYEVEITFWDSDAPDGEQYLYSCYSAIPEDAIPASLAAYFHR